MQTYGTLLNIVIPIFFLLYFIERFYEWKTGRHVIRSMDSISSFSSGITNVVKDVLGMSLSIVTYTWLVGKVAIGHVGDHWMAYVIAFIVIDLEGYLVHRWSHEINFLWNRHIIHHSSEEYNLSCALRQSISTFVNYFTILLLPAALFGVDPKVIAIVGPLHLFLQYWYHTQLIGKLGFLESFLVTPSHHRVHHAINKEYMDKNYGQIFIFWDKWFGTFQEELPEVPAVYGVSRPVHTWNPITINFQHFWLLFKDAWRAGSWWDKLRIWFMPTGWRPEDVAQRYPVYKIEDVYHFDKYDPQASRTLVAWSWVQLFFNYALLVYFFAFLGKIGSPDVFYYGALFFIAIFAYTELMDRNPAALFFEGAKSAICLMLIWQNGFDWFGMRANVGGWAVMLVAFYMVLSFVMTAYFVLFEFNKGSLVQNSRA